MKGIFWILLIASLVTLFGCGKEVKTPTQKPYEVRGRIYIPLREATGYTEEGLASWYGPGFHGKRTSSGEVFNMYEFTAAHKTLPLGTYVLVQNLENGRRVVVRINDRGPFVKGRIIDLSYAAARALGMVEKGVARVRIVAISNPSVTGLKGKFFLQVASFKEKENAMRLRKELVKRFKFVKIKRYRKGAETFYRVLIFLSTDMGRAVELYSKLKKAFPEARLVVE